MPHFGGAVANVALAAARPMRGSVALAGGAGGDAWGPWLRDRLQAAGVDLRWFALMEGQHTPVAFVALDAPAMPTYQIYGEGISMALEAVADRLPEAVRGVRRPVLRLQYAGRRARAAADACAPASGRSRWASP